MHKLIKFSLVFEKKNTKLENQLENYSINLNLYKIDHLYFTISFKYKCSDFY